MTRPADRRVVGRSVAKIDSLGLALGRAQFTDDLALPGLLYVKILGSPHAHARIRTLDDRPAAALPGVACVLHHANVPRVIHTTAGQGYPEPSPYDTYMFDSKVRFAGDRVAAVAAETEAIAEQALRLIEVDYDVLPAVLDARRAMDEGAPVIHDEPEAHILIPVLYEPERNRAAHVDFETGDLEAELAAAELRFDAEYETQYASHCALEPHIAIAWIDADGRVVIRTSTQVPFHVRRIVAARLELPVRRIRVVKPRIGGGFGGKQEVLLEDVAALAALRTGRPCRLAYTRAEEFIASRTRHPQVIRLRTGVDRDGTLRAVDLRVLMNTGAYGAHALTVACNSGSKVLPIVNKARAVRFWADTVYTNLPVGGAYRGYGATQSAFALGVQMDEMARAIGMDICDFWKMHHIRSGESSPVFAALGEGKAGTAQTIGSCALTECIDRGATAAGWSEKQGRRIAAGDRVRGLGMVCLMQGSSIPEVDMGAASIKMNEDGSFNLLVGATDLGTGSDTVLAQIAAEELGVSEREIVVYSSDTDLTPFDVGAYASSTTYLSGMAVLKAAAEVRRQILAVAAGMLDCPAEELGLEDGRVAVPDGGRSVTLGEIGLRTLYGRDQFQIMGTASHISHQSPPPFAAHFAEVEVDRRTGRIEVVHYVAAVDCGTAVNPVLAEGQTEGSVVNGIGYALHEDYIFDGRGRMLNPGFDHYKILSMADLPRLTTILVPSYEATGPFGAKSVSEISINGALPAISNAVFDAVGVRLRRAPFTAERVLAALRRTEE